MEERKIISYEGKDYVLVPVEEYEKERKKEIEKLDLGFNPYYSVEITGDRFEFRVLADEETLEVKKEFSWLTIYTDESQRKEEDSWDNPEYLRRIASVYRIEDVIEDSENYTFDNNASLSHQDWLKIKALCQKAVEYGWL